MTFIFGSGQHDTNLESGLLLKSATCKFLQNFIFSGISGISENKQTNIIKMSSYISEIMHIYKMKKQDFGYLLTQIILLFYNLTVLYSLENQIQ